MEKVSDIFQILNEEVLEIARPQCEGVDALITVINKHYGTKQSVIDAFVQFHVNHLMWAEWDKYKRKLDIYEDVKTAIEDNNADNVEDPEYIVKDLPVKPTWSDDDIAHITTDYVLGLPEVLEAKKSKLKEKRSLEVDNIVVEVDGMSFDGDEVSQNRMARAITALSVAEQPSTTWKLSNNELATVTKEQLAQALALAGQAQTDIWAHYG